MFGTSKLLNINDATKRIGNFFKLPIQLFHGVPYPELALYDKDCDLSAIKKFCRENGRAVHYSKNDVFVQQGCVGKYLGVVESGYFKYTTLTSSGNDAVVGFAFEGEIVADYYNSFNGLSSEVTIKAGIDSSVSQIRTPEARNIFYASLDGNLSAVNGALFREIYSRQLELYRKTPKERYIDLITLYPQILDIVSLPDIASYLLITPVYLSRIRKNLPKKSPEKNPPNKTCFIPKSFFLPNFANKKLANEK